MILRFIFDYNVQLKAARKEYRHHVAVPFDYICRYAAFLGVKL